MKQVFINNNNLSINDLDYEVIRVKGIVINHKNEVLLEHNNNTFQFPGGHLEDSEDMESALLREIKEETGIDIDDITGPFMQIKSYVKNYFSGGKNVCSKIYYYRLYTDKLPNLDETKYDELEQQTDFGLYYVPLEDLEKFLQECLANGDINKEICNEMLLALEEYNYLYGGV